MTSDDRVRVSEILDRTEAADVHMAGIGYSQPVARRLGRAPCTNQLPSARPAQECEGTAPRGVLQDVRKEKGPIVQNAALTDKICGRCGFTLPTIADW